MECCSHGPAATILVGAFGVVKNGTPVSLATLVLRLIITATPSKRQQIAIQRHVHRLPMGCEWLPTNLSAKRDLWLALTVVPMGWLWTAGVIQNFHRRISTMSRGQHPALATPAEWVRGPLPDHSLAPAAKGDGTSTLTTTMLASL